MLTWVLGVARNVELLEAVEDPVAIGATSGDEAATIMPLSLPVLILRASENTQSKENSVLWKFQLYPPNLHWWRLISQKHICLWMEIYMKLPNSHVNP